MLAIKNFTYLYSNFITFFKLLNINLDSTLSLPWFKFSIVLLITFIIINLLLVFVFSKTKKIKSLNIDNLLDANISKEFTNYFLFLSFIFPTADLFYRFYGFQKFESFKYALILGLYCLTIFLITRLKRYNHLAYPAFVFNFFLYLIYIAYCILKENLTIPIFAEFLLLLFLSFNIFKKFNYYIIFVVLSLAFIFTLFLLKPTETKNLITLVNATLIIVVINFARRVNTLQSNQKLYFSNDIINNSNSLIIATDKLGNLVYCNESVKNILGFEVEEVMGENFWKLTEDKNFEPIDYNLKFKPETIYNRTLKCKNGEFKDIQWSDYKYHNNLFVAVGQDVTQKIKIEKQYSDLVQKAKDIIYETDSNGNIISVNNFTLELSGYSENEVLGKHFLDFIHKDYKETVLNFYNKPGALTNEFDTIDFPIEKKSGELVWVSQKVNVRRDFNNKK